MDLLWYHATQIVLFDLELLERLEWITKLVWASSQNAYVRWLLCYRAYDFQGISFRCICYKTGPFPRLCIIYDLTFTDATLPVSLHCLQLQTTH